jgi:hypothetical protein
VRGSRSITDVGCAAAGLSNNNSSTRVAFREKTLKLTPPGRIVAPNGKLRPVCDRAAEILSSALDIDHFSPALSLCPAVRFPKCFSCGSHRPDWRGRPCCTRWVAALIYRNSTAICDSGCIRGGRLARRPSPTAAPSGQRPKIGESAASTSRPLRCADGAQQAAGGVIGCSSEPSVEGRYCCPACGNVPEALDGHNLVPFGSRFSQKPGGIQTLRSQHLTRDERGSRPPRIHAYTSLIGGGASNSLQEPIL